MCVAALRTHKKDPSLKRYDVLFVRPFFKGKFELIVLDLGLCVYIFWLTLMYVVLFFSLSGPIKALYKLFNKNFQMTFAKIEQEY